MFCHLLFHHELLAVTDVNAFGEVTKFFLRYATKAAKPSGERFFLRCATKAAEPSGERYTQFVGMGFIAHQQGT